MRLIAIAKEPTNHDPFVAQFWPEPAELYLDEPTKLPIFNECNGKSQGLASGAASYLVGGNVAAAVKRADDLKIEGDVVGEGLVLGTLLVVSKTGELLLHYKEKSWGDHPTDDVLREAISKI